jgi:glutathione synthase/RimK-type ligase-like ATP-grasp enzyme
LNSRAQSPGARRSRVLILSNKKDISCDWVVRALRNRGADLVRINTEDLTRGRATWWLGTGCFLLEAPNGRRLSSDEVLSVLYRRPGRPFGERPRPESLADVLNSQWRSFLFGLTAVEGALWINHPQKNNQAESKIAQLMTAKAIGLKTPKTLVSSNREDILAFTSQLTSGAVVKALDTPYFRADGKEAFLFTTNVGRQPAYSQEAFATAPIIVQERIEPRRDIRITIVGNRAFAAAPKGPVDYQDWRQASEPVPFEPIAVPDDLLHKCLEFLASFGLRFGAFDFVLHEGEFIFLEMNPNGEWGWLQAAGLPIAEALAEELLGRP